MIAAAQKPTYHSRLWIVFQKEWKEVWAVDNIVRLLVALAVFQVFQSPAKISPTPLTIVLIVLFGKALDKEKNGHTIEPLITTGARRSDIVIGKFLAAALIYCGCAVATVLMQMAMLRIPIVASMHPDVRTFHPTIAFVAQAVLILICGGLEMLAFSFLYSTIYAKLHRITFWIAGFLAYVIGLIGTYLAIESAIPFVNMLNSLMLLSDHVASGSENTWVQGHGGLNFVQNLVIASTTMTVVCLVLTIRNLNSGRWFEQGVVQPSIIARRPRVRTAKAVGGVPSYDVVLTEAGNQKIKVIKVIIEVTGMGLKECKDLVESAPQTIIEGIIEKDAETLRAKLVAAGARVDVVAS